MAVNFSFELGSKPTKEGRYIIYLRITQDRKLKRVKTDLSLARKKDWNSKQKCIRSSEPHYVVWNERLDAIKEEAQQKYRDLSSEGLASNENVAESIENKKAPDSFLSYAKRRTQEIYDGGGVRNWKKYVSFINKLENFQKDKKGHVKDILFTELTPAYLSKFEAYLHTLRNELHPDQVLHQNTIKEQFKIFKAIVNRAITVEGLMTMDKNPFLSYKVKEIKTQKEKLDSSELEALLAVDLKEGSLRWHSRNCFFFSFYCAGIRCSDLLQLRWCNVSGEGRIEYSMGKNHKNRDLKLVPQAKAILAYYYSEGQKPTDYIFPFLETTMPWAKAVTQEEKDVLPADMKLQMYRYIASKNALINKELKAIAKEAEVATNISMHIARHSFAKAAKAHNIDNSIVKELLAHSSLSITERYMGQFDSAENDAALAIIFEEPKDKVDTIMELVKELTPEQIETLKQHINNI